MKYSVIIPLYNKEKHIYRAVMSVLNQTFCDLELIVIDDGSTDNSEAIVKKIMDSRIRLISQRNMGASSARNHGIKASKNEYIGFLDADDEWKPDFLESINVLIEKYPEAGVYAAAYEIITDNNSKSQPRFKLRLEENWTGLIDDYFKYALKCPFLSSSSVVIPKRVFDDTGLFDETIRYGEDLWMWCKIALSFKIAYCNKICASYYQNADNRTDKKYNPINSFTDTFQWHAERVLSEGRKSKNYSFCFEEYILKMFIIKARYYIELNKRKQARCLLSKCRGTKYNKKYLLRVYIISFIPKSILGRL